MKVVKALLCVLPLAAIALAQGTGSDVVTATGNKIKGNVLVKSDTIEGVVYDDKGVETTVPYKDVVSVTYGDRPVSYAEAKAAFDRDKWDAALPKFQKAAEDPKITRMLQYALFYQAECYFFLNKYTEAEKAYKELLKQVPDTRFLPDAQLRMAQIKLKSDDKALWQKAADELKGLIAKAKKWSPLWETRFTVAYVSAARKAGSTEDFIPILTEAIKDCTDLDAINDANVEMVGIYQDKKDYQKAVEMAKKTIISLKEIAAKPGQDQNKIARVRAALYNQIGDCYRLAARAAPDAERKERYLDALLEGYLRAALLFPQVPQENPKALFWSGDCFRILRDTKRSQEMFDELKTRWSSDTEWMKKVEAITGKTEEKPATKKEGK